MQGAPLYYIKNGCNDIKINKPNHRIGFSNPKVCRNVLYNINPYKHVTYIEGSITARHPLIIDVNARIIIPKITRDVFDPIIDANMYMERVSEQEFLDDMNNYVLIMPNKLILEDEHDFVFNVVTLQMID